MPIRLRIIIARRCVVTDFDWRAACLDAERRYEAQKARTAEVAQLCKETTDRLLAERNQWKHWAEEYFYTDPDCECPLCDQVRAAIGSTK